MLSVLLTEGYTYMHVSNDSVCTCTLVLWPTTHYMSSVHLTDGHSSSGMSSPIDLADRETPLLPHFSFSLMAVHGETLSRALAQGLDSGLGHEVCFVL